MDWELVTSDGERQTVRVAPRLSCGAVEPVLQAAKAGLGIALLPDLVCRTDLDAGRLVHVLPDWLAKDGDVHLLFATRRGLTPAASALIDYLAQLFSQNVAAEQVRRG